MELKIIDENERKNFFWIKYETGRKRKYILHTMELPLEYILYSDPKEKTAYVSFSTRGCSALRKTMKYSQDISDETILMELTDIFFMVDPSSPAFPAKKGAMKKAGDYVIGLCKGYLGGQLIQVYGLRMAREEEVNYRGEKPKKKYWGVFMNWDQDTGKAQGYSFGLKSVNRSYRRYKREYLSQISCPDDVAMWASTLLRIQKLI